MDDGLALADDLRELWRLQGTPYDTTQELGFTATRPDYYVVRVSLLEPDGKEAEALGRALEWGPELVARYAASSKNTIKQKMGAKTLGEEERFVNVAGGRRKGPEIAAAMGWLQQKGWGIWQRSSRGRSSGSSRATR